VTMHSADVIRAFCRMARWTYDVWSARQALFDRNPHQAEIRNSAADPEFRRLAVITQEYLLFQIIKLHDPAVQNGYENLSIDYIVEKVEWDGKTKAELEGLRTQLERLADPVRSARNKLLSHNDLRTVLADQTLGEFSEGQDEVYFRTLLEFARLASDAVLGSHLHWGEDAKLEAEDMIKIVIQGIGTRKPDFPEHRKAAFSERGRRSDDDSSADGSLPVPSILKPVS
jgi:hypothetical protein